jgi:hypothetical protein
MASVPSIVHLFIHQVDHQRELSTPDGQGGHTKTYPSLGTLGGRIWPATQKDLQSSGLDRAERMVAALFPPGTDLRIGDRLIHEGRTYEVKVRAIPPSVPIYSKALAKEIQEG